MTFEQRRPREWRDAYRFPGFTPSRAVRGVDADPGVVVVTLHRRQKKRPAGALYVGTQCRGASITEVAEDLRLDWHAVKAMDTLYMRAPLDVAGPPAPAVIGIDEISIRKGHVYRIIISDLEAGRPIWLGGVDRSEASLAMF